jgi:hypothetical protein
LIVGLIGGLILDLASDVFLAVKVAGITGMIEAIILRFASANVHRGADLIEKTCDRIAADKRTIVELQAELEVS